MDKERINILKDFTVSAKGRMAVEGLLQALMGEFEGNLLGQMMVENEFLLKAKAITGEGPYDHITGEEEKAHDLLRNVLLIEKQGGREALGDLRKELGL